MEMRYDSLYQKEMIYKMTLEELAEQPYFSAENVLAYFRYRGSKATFYAYASLPEDITVFHTLGMAMTSGDKDRVPCKIYLEGRYNPFFKDAEDHWFDAYKLQYIPIEYNGCIESRYVSDFISDLNRGYGFIAELDEMLEEHNA